MGRISREPERKRKGESRRSDYTRGTPEDSEEVGHIVKSRGNGATWQKVDY